MHDSKWCTVTVTCISEERLTALTKKIFTEELEKQQQSLLKLIGGNFEIAMKEIKNIECEMNELKKASNLQRRFLKEKFRICRGMLVALKRKLMKYMIIR